MTRIFLILSIVIVTYSCSTSKYIYLNENDKESTDTNNYTLRPSTYSIQQGDVLYIQFHSALSESVDIFKFQTDQSMQSTGGNNMYLMQYVVSEKGYIKIPLIGDVYVRGMQTIEVEELLESEAKKYYADAIAKVKLVSYRVTFMGEFGSPGEKIFYKDNVHFLDGLAAAGEVTYYGDRTNIRIMRQAADGLKTYRINLNDVNLIESKEFYLQPNDYVYAEPLPRKVFRINAGDYSIILATISSTLAFVALIMSYNKS